METEANHGMETEANFTQNRKVWLRLMLIEIMEMVIIGETNTPQ